MHLKLLSSFKNIYVYGSKLPISNLPITVDFISLSKIQHSPVAIASGTYFATSWFDKTFFGSNKWT